MKNKLFKPVMAVVLATILAFGNIVPFSATVNETQTASESGNKEAEVVYTQDSNFIVTIPKKITLDSDKTSAYEVNVIGDIASDEKVTVVPDASFLMKDQATVGTLKEDITATVIQDKIEWTSPEIAVEGGSTTDGSVSAPDLTAGNWKGTFNFYINLDSNVSSPLTLSTDNVIMGAGDSVQVNAYMNGQLSNDTVIWSSDNENITVTDGLIETKAAAQVGETATITVSAIQTAKLSRSEELLQDLGLVLYAQAADDISIDFTVTIVDIEYSVEEVNIKPGESLDVTAKILPDTVSGTVTWSQTAISGINLVKNGNTVTIKVASDMETGKSYNLIATYGDYSKTLKINIISDHVHSYTSSITKEATCTETGEKTFTCKCGNFYTEVITATGHNYENGSCTECDEADPDYVAQEAGLYDADGNLLCTWEASGIDVETDYSGTSSDADYYKNATTSGYYVLTNNYPTATKLIIPDGVTHIGNETFDGCSSLNNIKLPDSVTSIGNWAFQETGLTSIGVTGSGASIEIPSSVTSLGDGVFYNCTSLTSVELPSNVTSIGNQIFRDCTNLTSIKIPESVTSIGNYAFYNCTGEAIINCNISSASVPAYGAFYNSKFTKVTIENGVTSIGDYAFYNCTSLTSIMIPDSVTSIKNSVFYNCTSLTNIDIPDGVTYIGSNTFNSCKSLTNVTIPNSVTSIGSSAFSGCKSLTNIDIPDGVTYIGSRAFGSCTNITIPSSVTNIGEQAFLNCTGEVIINCNIPDASSYINAAFYDSKFTKVTIGNGVTSIGNYAFYDCSSLTNVTISSSVTSIGDSAFYNCTGLTSINIPDSVTSISDGAFFECTGLTRITIPDSVTSIGRSAFGECTGLTRVTIGNGVTSIGSSAFCNCTGLTSITIPDSVTSIGSSAFGNCTGLTSVTIGNGITSIGEYAFAYCTGLTSVTIPDSVTSIGSQAFYNCTGLTNVTVGKGVTSIGDYAFYNCSSLTDVTIPDRVTSIGYNAFNSCTSLTSVIMGSGVTSIEYEAFSGCKKLTSVTIGENVTNIGPYAFKGCTSLNSIIIPDNVTSIGSQAFSGCTLLTTITIGSGVTNIEYNAFYKCGNLTYATFKTTSGWYVGDSKGAKTTALNLPSSYTAATYLKSTYVSKYWTR